MIDEQTVVAVIAKVERLGVEEDSVRNLRKDWEDIHFTYCMDDDIGIQDPYKQADGFNVYLVTGRDQCVSFTSSLENATGLVIASLDVDAV